jgi:hypothetical protein
LGYDKSINKALSFMFGNVISNHQFSWYVRAHSQTECNGFDFPLGQLRASDLKAFESYGPWFRRWHEQNFSKYAHLQTVCTLLRDVGRNGVILRGLVISDTCGRILFSQTLGSGSARRFNAMVLAEAVRLLPLH